MDIREYPEIIEEINKILERRGTAEIKNEARQGAPNLVVVEIKRLVRTKKPC